jgi:multiple sugar transport system permease protein
MCRSGRPAAPRRRCKEANTIEQRIRRKDLPFIISLMLPGVLIFAVIIIIPAILAIQYSFYEAKGFVGQARYVGLDNYAALLESRQFWNSFFRTILYAGATVALQLVIGISIAMVLNQPFKGNTIVRGVTVVPYIIPVVVVTIGIEWMIDPSNGIINHIIASLGMEKINFLSPKLAMMTSILMSTWTWTPFVALVFLAGLQTVSHEIHESAMLDGANAWKRFWLITLPMMKDIIVMIILLRGLWMFNKFDLIWLLTGGGPLQKTETLPVLIYDMTFKQFRVGYGSALAVVSLIVMFVAMSVYLKMMKESSEKRKFRKMLERMRRKEQAN